MFQVAALTILLDNLSISLFQTTGADFIARSWHDPKLMFSTGMNVHPFQGETVHLLNKKLLLSTNTYDWVLKSTQNLLDRLKRDLTSKRVAGSIR